jgi:hypothetical protein
MTLEQKADAMEAACRHVNKSLPKFKFKSGFENDNFSFHKYKLTQKIIEKCKEASLKFGVNEKSLLKILDHDWLVFEIDENYEENSFRVEAQNILKLVKKMYNQTEFKIRAITIDDITSRMTITRNKVRLTIRFSDELKTFLREVNKTRIIDRKPVYDNYINFKKLYEQNEDIGFVCEKMGFSKRQFYYYRSLTNKISKLLNK